MNQFQINRPFDPMTDNHSHAPDLRSEDVKHIAAMSEDQRRDYLDRIDYAATVERRAAEERALQARVADGVATSMAHNQQLMAQRMGMHKMSATALDGQVTTQSLHAGAGSNAVTAPQALVDALPVFVGGIQLGPKQAQEMLARGEITHAAYAEGLAAALAPYGMKAPTSFR